MKELPAGCLEMVGNALRLVVVTLGYEPFKIKNLRLWSNMPSSKPDIPYIKIHDTLVIFLCFP